MESKRKANGATVASEDLDDRAAKRRKPSDIDLSYGETAETTTQLGLQFLDQVKRTADKNGRLVATNFLTLPSRKSIPQYYEVIKMPIAMDTIEEKLNSREFPTLTTLESYFKRMVSNAKDFNEKGSEIYDDAERLRKALSNHMTKVNPAYKTKGYIAFPTPLTGEENQVDDNDEEGSDEDAEGDAETEVTLPPPAKRRPGRPPKNPVAFELAKQQRLSLTPAGSDAQYANVGFGGLTFQQAQEKIISDMLRYKEDEDDEDFHFSPFITLPNRQDFKDYYQVIPHPVSLKGLQKLVRGIHGRGENTGVTDFKSWAAFEDEVSSIWMNAWHYNEDGSYVFELAKELEIFFNKKLKEAKATVTEPLQPKIKLKMSAPDPAPKITLRVSGTKGSPVASPAPSAGMNGNAPKNPFGGPQTAILNLGQLDRARSMSGSVASPSLSTSILVKNEDLPKESPSIQHAGSTTAPGVIPVIHQSSTSNVNGNSMPPPVTTTPGLVAHTPYFNSQGSHNQPAPYHVQNPGYESKWRAPGKDASDAMISNLSLATHPGLNISRHFRMDLPPSDTMSQQSITINLPHTHYYLQIKPTIAAGLLERQHKLFVTSGTQRLHAMPTIPGTPVDARNPLFEARLLPGVNRIEVELIAAFPKGAPKPAAGQDVELEKVVIFANLLRS